MKNYCWLFLLLIFLPYAIADDWQFNAKDITADVTIKSKISIITSSSNNKLSYISANLTLFPKEDDIQKRINLEVDPTSKITDSSINFLWENPNKDEYPFSVKSVVQIKNKFTWVDKKIGFPLNDIPTEFENYIKPTKNIDSDNEDIILLASKIAQGQDDAYIVLFKLAEWVENSINYSLDTLTADASQKSSWVLKNRYGVCDELTSLFLALAKSLGFPGKFISGLAYTNWNDLNDFGPHAWAEIYLPDYGWIPFDVTYGEFGWIDPTHIKLMESPDSDEPSINYQWLGNNVDIQKEDLDLKAIIKNVSVGEEEPIELTISPYRDDVGFGSYNIIEVELKSLVNSYMVVTLYASNTKELEFFGNSKKFILLKPYESKKVFWVLNVHEDLDRNYIYTFPIVISSLKNITAKTQFKSTILDKVYQRGEIEAVLKEFYEEDEKVYSRNLQLVCSAEKIEIHVNENTNVNCMIKNMGNTILDNLRICLEDDCKKFDLGITQEKNASFVKSFDSPGIRDIKITANNEFVSKASFVQLVSLDDPSINISNVSIPKEVNFHDEFEITMEINRASISIPRNVNLYLKQGRLKQHYELNDLENNQMFIIQYKGSMLKEGFNELKVIINFMDDKDSIYEVEKSFDVELAKLTFFQKIQSFVNRVAYYFSNL